MKTAKRILGLWTFLATIGMNPIPAMIYGQPPDLEQVEARKTGCDDAGRCSYVVAFPDQPMTIRGGSEDFVLLRRFAFSLPSSQFCWQASTFIGLDSGDRGEFDISLTTASNFQVFDRSYHRHVNGSFESYWPHYINVTAKDFRVIVLGRVTGENQFGELSARYHVGLKLQCQDSNVVPEPEPEPEPEPKPEPETKPTQYIPWQDREAWARGIELAYTEWRGHRDLQGLYDRPQYLKDGEKELVPMTRSELLELMNTMIDAQARSRTLQYRIVTEKHREFADRSQVRKARANKMRKELEELTREYGAISSKIPLVAGCDAITCRLKKLGAE